MLLARRNLLRDRTRFLLSVLGVAVSVGLILLLAGYRSGVYRQASAYLDNTPGTVVVAERGIRDFLGTSSVLPPDTADAVRSTAGVDRVIPVVSQFVIFERHERKDGFFLIGYDPTVGGGPWKLVEGREPTADNELVVDRTTARQHDMATGDRVRLLDRDATIVGLSDETTFWAGSVAFARISTLESLLRAPGLRSFIGRGRRRVLVACIERWLPTSALHAASVARHSALDLGAVQLASTRDRSRRTTGAFGPATRTE